MRRWLYCLPFITLLFGCLSLPVYTSLPAGNINPPLIIPVFISPRFSSIETGQINEALSEWNYALNGWIRLDPAPFDMEMSIIREANEKETGLFIMESAPGNINIPTAIWPSKTLAWTETIGREEHQIFLIPSLLIDREIFRGVLLHEIGHALGAGHSSNSRSLMAPAYNGAGFHCVDQETAEQVSKKQGLPIDGLNYCH